MKSTEQVLRTYDCKIIEDEAYFKDSYTQHAMAEYSDGKIKEAMKRLGKLMIHQPTARGAAYNDALEDAIDQLKDLIDFNAK